MTTGLCKNQFLKKNKGHERVKPKNFLKSSIFPFLPDTRFQSLSHFFSPKLLPKMSHSKPIHFTDLNFDIFENVIKYFKFDALVRFELVNSIWRDAIRSLL